MHLLFPFAVFLVATSALGVLGRGLRAAWGRTGGADPFERLLLDVYVGLWAVTTGYAALVTGGRTVMLGILVILFLVPRQAQERCRSTTVQLGWWVPAALAAVAAFLWESLPFGSGPANFPWRLPYLDSPFYSLTSLAISETGVESTLAIDNAFRAEALGPAPYHYVELWLNAVVFRLSGLPTLVAFHTVVVPLYLFLCLLGLLSLFSEGMRRRPLLATLAMFAGASALLADHPQFWDFSLWGLVDAHSKKAGPWFVALLGAAIRFRAEDYRGAGAHLLTLVVATISAAPAALGGLVLLGCWIVFRRSDLRTGSSIVAPAILLGLLLAAFYTLSGETAAIASPAERLGREDTVTVGNMARLGLMTAGRLAALYAPWGFGLAMALTGSKLRRGDLAFLGFIAAMAVVGFSVWAPLVKVRDSAQVFLLPTFTGLWVATAVLWSQSVAEGRVARIGRGLLVSLALLNLTVATDRQWNFNFRSLHAPEYLETVRNLLNQPRVLRGASIHAGRDAETFTYRGHPLLLRLGWYLLLMPSNAYTVPISDFDLPSQSAHPVDTQSALHVAPFTLFVTASRREGTFASIEASQASFVRHWDLSFVILSRNAVLPAGLRDATEEWLLDPISGERFALLARRLPALQAAPAAPK